jgi:hypothetical protein
MTEPSPRDFIANLRSSMAWREKLSASIRKYGDVWDPKKCLAMLTQH